MTIALYGPSYWDVVVDVELAALAGGKGKLPVTSAVVLGGFPANAARALAALGRRARVVTVVPADEAARVRAGLPPTGALDAIAAPPGWLPVTVVLDPDGACRILRDPGASLDGRWRWDAVAAEARAAALHVLGRVPPRFAAEVLAAARATGARVAWCGGANLGLTELAGFDLACVNASEAAALVGVDDTAAAARALLAAATPAGAARVVTGGARQPSVAAVRVGDAVTTCAVAPAAIAPAAVRTLLGAGDAFAAALVVTAALGDDGAPRAALAMVDGLAAGQRAAARVITGGGDG